MLEVLLVDQLLLICQITDAADLRYSVILHKTRMLLLIVPTNAASCGHASCVACHILLAIFLNNIVVIHLVVLLQLLVVLVLWVLVKVVFIGVAHVVRGLVHIEVLDVLVLLDILVSICFLEGTSGKSVFGKLFS